MHSFACFKGNDMAGQTGKIVQHLRKAVLLQEAREMTDGQLLESFLSKQDEAAFATLLRRHGPMVWGVCRRVLRNHHDAEDAFQATFLVLQELSRLPDKYRTPIILCELEGKTHRDAASQLGWPIGTLSGRLSRARALLAR